MLAHPFDLAIFSCGGNRDRPTIIKIMPLKILIAPDKFKGSLTARAAAQAIAAGWSKARPDDSLTLLPLSDGGDGFGEVLGNLMPATIQNVSTVDAAHRSCQARWWWEPKTKTAVIESAEVIGLAMLPAGKFHPFELDTFGLGALLQAALTKGARRCLIGIGGSATNDGGFGLARALGWEFLDAGGGLIQRWTKLHTLATIQKPRPRRWFAELIVAVDVQNPLLGVRGATRVYGPQKGLQPADLAAAEKNLGRLALVVSRNGTRYHNRRGAGAAGGLGFGLLTFLGARMEPGFAVFARHAELEKYLRSADLVITGEGRLDSSTLMGKGTGQLARRCRALKIPCLALAGTIAEREKVQRRFAEIHVLTDLTTLTGAQAKPVHWLKMLAQRVAQDGGIR